jgi:hypothetical protein
MQRKKRGTSISEAMVSTRKIGALERPARPGSPSTGSVGEGRNKGSESADLRPDEVRFPGEEGDLLLEGEVMVEVPVLDLQGEGP